MLNILSILYRKPVAACTKCMLLLWLLLLAPATYAHTINYALEKAPDGNIFLYYLKLGYLHILPNGFDHILFITGLCLLSTKLSTILWQATAFTIAHSITLALSVKNIIVAPPAVVEPVIALSILCIAVENLLVSSLSSWRIAIVFVFGLIHGMGFASALHAIGLPRNKFFLSIFSFNAGVELGQVTVILIVFGLIIIPLRNIKNYKKIVVSPLSVLIALTALYWTIQRIFFA
ncbi:HupE/UreJ family protein [Parafilimonas sp.]|uniref:HupE/UreJ family protein n=1 Tax=Parafilimonas sp. TaxID=1969739 RepID=UPI0039E4E68D